MLRGCFVREQVLFAGKCCRQSTAKHRVVLGPGRECLKLHLCGCQLWSAHVDGSSVFGGNLALGGHVVKLLHQLGRETLPKRIKGVEI